VPAAEGCARGAAGSPLRFSGSGQGAERGGLSRVRCLILVVDREALITSRPSHRLMPGPPVTLRRECGFGNRWLAHSRPRLCVIESRCMGLWLAYTSLTDVMWTISPIDR
jgi:hypothetical protein